MNLPGRVPTLAGLGLLVGLGVFAVLGAGCTVGGGSGAASGPLWVLGCREGGADQRDFGTRAAPKVFDLEPGFFAGEPIDDIDRVPPRTNRLIVRMQRSGRRRELNDVLAFDIVNTYEVARCVRGRTIVDATGMRPDYDGAACFQGPGGARIRVGTDALVHASLAMRSTCTKNAIAAAVSPTREAKDGAWESWIELHEFGGAAQAGRPPHERTPVDVNFKVDLGQRLHAPRFHVELEDARVVDAERRGVAVPQAELGGSLDGFFDFDLERGQGGQTFP